MLVQVPSGVVSFLFTDIVGSTSMWENAPGMDSALVLHNRLLLDVFSAHGGFVFSNTGDGFAVAFDDPVAALVAADEGHRALVGADWPDGAQISTRMGLHVGRAHEREGNYFGPPVNRAARLMSIAGAQHLLISGSVEELLRGVAPDRFELHDLGSLRLKDVVEPVRVFSVETEYIKRCDEMTSRERPSHDTLPVTLTELVGRDDERERIAAEVQEHRLVSMVGPGGAGKTALAVEVARAAQNSFEDGVWFAALTDVGESSSVVEAIGHALGFTGTVSTTEELITSTLRRRHVLLLIDNCEHVLDGVTETVQQLLQATESVHVLVTSRTPLQLVGEVVEVIDPLSLESSGGEPSDAAKLFIERARAGGAPIEVAELGHVERLCRALDGLPLAIELAAARARALPPSRLVTMLDERYDLLVTDTRGTDRRHRTLRTLVESSFDLLNPVEQDVFAHLGVFAGAFDLDDAMAVAQPDGASRVDVINAVVGLVKQSLIQQRSDEVAPYRLLETLRGFALEQLAARDQEPLTRDRHARWLRDVAAEVRRECAGPNQRLLAERVFVRRSDFEDAVGWAAANGDLETAICIVVDLNTLGSRRGWRQASSWLSFLLDEPPDPLPDQWAEFLAASASTALNNQGSVSRAIDLAHQALELDPENPQALIVLAHTSRTATGCLDYARRTLASPQALAERSWEVHGRVYECFGLLLSGHTAEAHQRALDLQRFAGDAGDRSGVGWARYLVARALSHSDPARAMIVLEEARAIAEEVGDPQLEINARRHRGAALIAGRDPEAAEASIRRGMLRALELGELDHVLRTCALSSLTFALRGEDDAAAIVIGRLGLPTRTPDERVNYQEIFDDLQTRLGDRFDALQQHGGALTAQEVVDFVLSRIEAPTDGATQAQPGATPANGSVDGIER